MTVQNSELANRLALLANEAPGFENGKRVLATTVPFDAVLQLIDQTILQATLEISSGTKTLVLEVSGRRLIKIPNVAEVLSADDEESLTAAAKSIANFADTASGQLFVRELATLSDDADPAQSVSIAALATAAGRPLIDVNAPPVEQFCARLGDALVAGRTFSGPDALETLGENASAFDDSLVQLAELIENTSEPRLTLISVDDTAGPIQGVVSDKKNALAFVVSETSFEAVFTAYNLSVSS